MVWDSMGLPGSWEAFSPLWSSFGYLFSRRTFDAVSRSSVVGRGNSSGPNCNPTRTELPGSPVRDRDNLSECVLQSHVVVKHSHYIQCCPVPRYDGGSARAARGKTKQKGIAHRFSREGHLISFPSHSSTRDEDVYVPYEYETILHVWWWVRSRQRSGSLVSVSRCCELQPTYIQSGALRWRPSALASPYVISSSSCAGGTRDWALHSHAVE